GPHEIVPRRPAPCPRRVRRRRNVLAPGSSRLQGSRGRRARLRREWPIQPGDGRQDPAGRPLGWRTGQRRAGHGDPHGDGDGGGGLGGGGGGAGAALGGAARRLRGEHLREHGRRGAAHRHHRAQDPGDALRPGGERPSPRRQGGERADAGAGRGRGVRGPCRPQRQRAPPGGAPPGPSRHPNREAGRRAGRGARARARAPGDRRAGGPPALPALARGRQHPHRNPARAQPRGGRLPRLQPHRRSVPRHVAQLHRLPRRLHRLTGLPRPPGPDPGRAHLGPAPPAQTAPEARGEV
ncbi:MAG: hypothetical protein AVDCRST_MAG68-3721, partial [uncultured Gemmatimonadetes bacterium]